MKSLFVIVGLCIGVFFAPLTHLHLRSDIHPPATAPKVDAVLIFGAIVRGGTISPLHKQRLDAGIAMLKAGKTHTLVVSNSQRAATFMYDYLLDQGVPETVIEIDGTATHTPLTCAAELQRDQARTVGFISQTFHLPRLAYQCWQLGLQGQLITANQPSNADLWTKIRVRTTRHTREAALVWGAILGLYPE
ncbi:MAG: ElyC/SanA/YdcF family protein [Planktomarina sp.]